MGWGGCCPVGSGCGKTSSAVGAVTRRSVGGRMVEETLSAIPSYSHGNVVKRPNSNFSELRRKAETCTSAEWTRIKTPEL